MIYANQTLSGQSLDRVKAWLAADERPRAQIARVAGVDEKTIRQAAGEGWNPTVNTLQKLEAIMPSGFVSASKKRRAA